MAGTSLGIGGKAEYASFPATWVGFERVRWPLQRPQLLVFKVDLLVALPTCTNRGVPSLLGRDLIDSWKMTYDRFNGRLDCLPHSHYYAVRL